MRTPTIANLSLIPAVGDVVFPLPTAGRHRSIAGGFAPTSAFRDLAPVMQVHQELRSGTPVFEVPISPTPTAGPVALQRLTDEEAQGLPAARQLVLHDEQGQPVRVRLIALDRLPTPPSGQPDLLVDACAAAQIPYSGFYLHAAPYPRADARED